jgi:hypothetical protein
MKIEKYLKKSKLLKQTKERGLYGEFFNPIYSGISQILKSGKYQVYVMERGHIFPEGSFTPREDAEYALKRLRRYHGMLDKGELNTEYTKGEPLFQSDLVRRLRYYPASGEFLRLTKFADHEVGDVAGYTTKRDSHRSIGFLGQVYAFHKLAWLAYYGEFPMFLIYHVNGDKANNAITNLKPMVSLEEEEGG